MYPIKKANIEFTYKLEQFALDLQSKIEARKDGKEVNLFEPQYRFFKAVLLDTLSEVKELFWHSSMNILVQLVTLRLVKLLLVQSKRVML